MNLVISEAMATGLPVVTTRHSGLPEQVVDGYNGCVAAEGDSHDLANKLKWLILHSEVWEAYGHNARERVLQKYDSKILIPQQVGVYRSLLEGKPSSL